MSSAFKDGVDAGLSDFMAFYNDLSSASLDADPANFARLGDLAGKVPDLVNRMQSAFNRIGENLTGDWVSWATSQKQKLLTCCSNVLQVAATLAPLAATAQQATQAVQDLGDPGDDDDKKSQAAAATDQMNTAIGAVHDSVESAKGYFTDFHDTLREVNDAFKTAVAQVKSTADAGQGPVDQAVNDMRNVESQAASKQAEMKSAQSQFTSQNQAYYALCAKVDDKITAEKVADQAVLDGAKKDPPLNASDLQSLEQAAATAKQDRERAEAERDGFYSQTLRPAWDLQHSKNDEMFALTQQWSALKQRRDAAVNALNTARTAQAQFNLEYQEPSL